MESVKYNKLTMNLIVITEDFFIVKRHYADFKNIVLNHSNRYCYSKAVFLGVLDM